MNTFRIKKNNLYSMQDFTGMMTNEETFYTVDYEDTKYAGLDFSSAKGTRNYCKLVF